MELTAEGQLDRDRFESRLRVSDATGIDLSGASWVDVYALVGIACMLDEAHHNSSPLAFTGPKDPEVARYLARMHLQVVLDGAADQQRSQRLPGVREHPREDVLVELERFSSEWDLERLGDFLWHRLRSKVGAQQLNALYTALLELGSNAVEHSGARGGFVAAQAYMVGRQGERIDLALGDAGQGIAATMARHQPANDAHAIELALRPDISGTGEPGRGQGLPETVAQATSLGGVAYVRSGTAKFKIRSQRRTQGVVASPRGTLIGVSIPCR